MQKGYIGFDKRLKYLFDNATEVSYEQTLSSGTPIGTITIDGQSETVYAPSGGGSGNVSYTPVVTSGEQLGILSIDGVNNNIYAPTVEANPSGTATGNLSSIQIGNSIYDIVGGGSGGSGVPYTCDELFVNDPLPSPTSGTSSVTRSYTLSHSIDDYDAVYVMSYSEYNTNGVTQISTQLILKKDYYDAATQSGYEDWVFLNNGSVGNTYRRLIMSFTDSTHIKTITGTRESGNEPILYKVYGLKFSSTIISPEIYSTEEREVGVFEDGKPIYQKSFVTTSTLTFSDNSWITTSLILANVDKFIDSSITDVDGARGVVWAAVNSSNNIMLLMSRSNSYLAGAIITVQYTKTTDSPGSGTWSPTGQFEHLYSTTEHIVGKWIDGKYIYERTWDLGNQVQFPNNTWTDLGLQNVPSIDKIISHEGLQGNSATSICFDVWYNNGTIKAKSLRTEDEHIRYLTLRYTKV